MKDVIEEQRQLLLKETRPLWNSELESDRKIAAALDGSIREVFHKIEVEVDFVIAHLEGDAGRLEMGARKVVATRPLLVQFAKAMRYYARRLESSGVANESEETRLIVLPPNGYDGCKHLGNDV